MTDGDIILRTRSLMEDVIDTFGRTTWGNPYINGLKSLQDGLSSPCVLAVAGKVKAGKSFLINSLLGVDLAMTGCTETTATINIFQKGSPISPELPVLCQWIDGTKEWKPKSFLDSLQGTDQATLNITSKIDKLVFYVEGNPLLEDVILVDTPGIGADVGDEGDAHQIQTDSYFKLRERHQSETKDLSKDADAVIYLFNTVPTETDRDFLSALSDGGKGLSALNGIGVLSKIDKNLLQLENIEKFSREFERELFAIMPTSAAISRYLPERSSAIRLKEELKNGFTSENGFKLSMNSESAFLHEKLPDCKIPVIKRKSILNEFAATDLPWSTFKLVATELYYNDDIDIVLTKLKSIAGIEPLRTLIYNHFFGRSRILKCNRILSELMKTISEVLYSPYFVEAGYMSKMKQECINQCDLLHEPYKKMVVSLIEQHVDSIDIINQAKDKIIRIKCKIEELQSELADINNCYIAYQKVMASKDAFSEAELEELGMLLSAKSIPFDKMQRQRYWAAVSIASTPNSVRQIVANVAKARYNKLIRSEQK